MIPTKVEQIPVAIHTSDPADEPGRPAPETAGAGSLDKVRDILFGGQVREFERRFARLEERLVKETSDLKDDVRKRLDALELYARKETESLSEQIRAEHQAQLESSNRLGRELKESATALERRTTTLDEQLARAQREFRQQMLEQHQRLSDDIRQKVDDVLTTLTRETDELRNDKADRAALASLLTEMALRLTNELKIPGTEGLEHG